jgi:hypothetical protein
MTESLIVTECVLPLFPTFQSEWVAYIRDNEDGPTGRGPTEAESLRDLCDQLARMLP